MCVPLVYLVECDIWKRQNWADKQVGKLEAFYFYRNANSNLWQMLSNHSKLDAKYNNEVLLFRHFLSQF